METVSKEIEFFIHVAKLQAVMSRKFDARLNGLGFSEFVILHYLAQAEGEKMRRVDLAEKVGLTASGITRLLLPMEKIGLVKRELDKNDARVSFVALARGGKTKYTEGLERAQLCLADTIPAPKLKKLGDLSTFMSDVV